MTGALAGGYLLVDPSDAGLVAFLAREGARAVGARRRLPTAVAALLAGLEQAASDARSAAGTGIGAASQGPSGLTSENLLSVRETAVRLETSDSYVRRLCRSGTLIADRRGPVWLVDADSVAAFSLRRAA